VRGVTYFGIRLSPLVLNISLLFHTILSRLIDLKFSGGDNLVEWDYKIVRVDGVNEEENVQILKAFGKDGWELIQVQKIYGARYFLAYFKKRIEDLKPPKHSKK
jgi:hypothetical protein